MCLRSDHRPLLYKRGTNQVDGALCFLIHITCLVSQNHIKSYPKMTLEPSRFLSEANLFCNLFVACVRMASFKAWWSVLVTHRSALVASSRRGETVLNLMKTVFESSWSVLYTSWSLIRVAHLSRIKFSIFVLHQHLLKASWARLKTYSSCLEALGGRLESSWMCPRACRNNVLAAYIFQKTHIQSARFIITFQMRFGSVWNRVWVVLKRLSSRKHVQNQVA